MNRIKRWWNSVSGKLSATGTATEDITARELCRMMQKCPVCQAGFDDHQYAHFAVTILGENRRGRVKEFFEACEERRWDEAKEYQDFDPKRDAVVAYVMRCSTGGVALLLERSPVELYEADRLIACDVIPESSGKELAGLISQNDWRRLSWT